MKRQLVENGLENGGGPTQSDADLIEKACPHDRIHRLNKITWKQTQVVLNLNLFN